jgi:DNA-binding transcriptional LysR family regulator
MREEQLVGLIAFLKVAEHKSFTRAGAALGVTPSAVSQTLKQLEERLGTRLLHRTTRSVSLTEAGERLLARVRPALEEVTTALDELSSLEGKPTGTLRLNLPRVGSAMFVEPVLADFMRRYPDVKLEVTLDDALVDIVGGGFDAGIRLGERLEKDAIGVRLGGDVSLAVVGAPSYFERAGVPRHPRELHGHGCILFRRMPSGMLYKWEFEENGRQFEVAPPPLLIVNDSALMVRSVQSGIGLAQVLTESVKRELEEGSLVRVLKKYSAPFRGFSLYYPSRAQMPLKLKVFVDFLRARFNR